MKKKKGSDQWFGFGFESGSIMIYDDMDRNSKNRIILPDPDLSGYDDRDRLAKSISNHGNVISS